jgi:hypothetical protein
LIDGGEGKVAARLFTTETQRKARKKTNSDFFSVPLCLCGAKDLWNIRKFSTEAAVR